jgi:hypothetical protein
MGLAVKVARESEVAERNGHNDLNQRIWVRGVTPCASKQLLPS